VKDLLVVRLPAWIGNLLVNWLKNGGAPVLFAGPSTKFDPVPATLLNIAAHGLADELNTVARAARLYYC
jgi:hypothetical protein